MDKIFPMLMACLTGFVSGLLLSIPVGPVNLTIINEGARRGFKWALLIGLGATSMEVIYCLIAFTGFASLFNHEYIKQGMELFSFVFMLYLGAKFLMAKSVNAPIHLGAAAHRIEERIEERLQSRSAFMTGFVRVMANLGVLVFWMLLAGNFISHGWVQPDWPGKLACVTGVALGTSLWFFVLSFGASRGHGKFSEKTLLRMEHYSGVCLLLLALFYGGQIVWEMVNH
jgi:threonine/homoserine/homoserine lactone efflux protein